jgi:hypothetical protein
LLFNLSIILKKEFIIERAMMMARRKTKAKDSLGELLAGVTVHIFCVLASLIAM